MLAPRAPSLLLPLFARSCHCALIPYSISYPQRSPTSQTFILTSYMVYSLQCVHDESQSEEYINLFSEV
ncbi:hypothetical protein PISMIDRAFT_669844 [Pisolithus microcarpus 441]|uniref:Secreted protein n=1 Tax=Pisolithus microcarpus 441 TaxID=765257 RepID=A0A0C9ZNE7_9AGAM|nr:hypothetical protein PISMIDRAFT_669844 [Pisolithus microcarpus 441]